MRASSQPRHVYVAADAEGRHKIGITANLKLRAYHLARDARREVKIIHHEPLDPQAELVEQTAMWFMADQQDHGEWFTVSADEMLNAIAKAKLAVARGEVPERRLSVLKRPTLGPRLEAAIEGARMPGETRKAFLRAAVEAELKRREKPKR